MDDKERRERAMKLVYEDPQNAVRALVEADRRIADLDLEANPIVFELAAVPYRCTVKGRANIHVEKIELPNSDGP